MDKISKDLRSRNMSRIKSKNTRPEILLRKELYKKGFRYRIHFKLLGKPDIAFPSKKVAVFVHGCFWHGHECNNDHKVKSNSEFWTKKILKNKERDIKNEIVLKDCGWKVIVVWECEIKKYCNKAANYIISNLD